MAHLDNNLFFWLVVGEQNEIKYSCLQQQICICLITEVFRFFLSPPVKTDKNFFWISSCTNSSVFFVQCQCLCIIENLRNVFFKLIQHSIDLFGAYSTSCVPQGHEVLPAVKFSSYLCLTHPAVCSKNSSSISIISFPLVVNRHEFANWVTVKCSSFRIWVGAKKSCSSKPYHGVQYPTGVEGGKSSCILASRDEETLLQSFHFHHLHRYVLGYLQKLKLQFILMHLSQRVLNALASNTCVPRLGWSGS